MNGCTRHPQEGQEDSHEGLGSKDLPVCRSHPADLYQEALARFVVWKSLMFLFILYLLQVIN